MTFGTLFVSTDKWVIDSHVILSEHAVELLLKAFRVGVHSKVESASYINDAMQLLNLETMQQWKN